jgi:S1-C subfamily serine protease
MRSWAAALALVLAVPAALAAQDRHEGHGRGYMGILFGWDDDGVATVREVTPGSPAERAGIRRGDVIVRIDNHPATRDAVDDLREHLDRGDTVHLRVRHDGREDERVVVAGERPDHVVFTTPNLPGGVWRSGDHSIVIRMDTIAVHMDSLLQRMDSLRGRIRRHAGDSIVIRVDTLMRVWHDSLMRNLPRAEMEFRRAFPMIYDFGSRSMAGAEFAEMNAGLARHFGGTDHGLLVLQVAPSTPAARAGLQAGDVVVEANGRAVARPSELREAFTRADGQEVRLTVLRDGRRQQVNVRWEAPETRVWQVEPSRRRIEIRRP